MTQQQELDLCKAGIAAWQNAFNSQDARGCAAQYATACIMHARPIGSFDGRENIEAFWQDIIDQGFCDVAYTDVVWEKHPETGYLLSANWTMNKPLARSMLNIGWLSKTAKPVCKVMILRSWVSVEPPRKLLKTKQAQLVVLLLG